jgi:DNA-directed RNA polymerase II subunit RPB11
VRVLSYLALNSNLLVARRQLLANPAVLFAGYKVPHPLHPYFIIKLQTDGTATPTQIVDQACTTLIGQLNLLSSKFAREFSFKDAEGAVGGTATAQEDPYGGSGGAWLGGRDYMDF